MTVIITGAPRSGTTYVSRVLSQYGLKVSHERWQDELDVFVDWHDVPMCRRNTKTIHLVREPLKCISSMSTMHEGSVAFFKSHVPATRDLHPSSLAFLCECWLSWTHMAALKSSKALTFRLEVITDARSDEGRKLLEAVTGTRIWHWDNVSVFDDVPSDTNSREHIWWSMRDVEIQCPQYVEPLLRAYDRFGYGVPA